MDTYDFLADPRTLTLTERQDARDRLEAEHDSWLERLQRLAEAPLPDGDFPAFLLATPPFHDLARKLEHTTARSQLPPEVADELDWFLRAFQDYLRTQDGEDVFADGARLTG